MYAVVTGSARRLWQLEQEKERLKKLLADSMLDKAMLKEINAAKVLTPGAKRQAVAHLQKAFEVSQRRARPDLASDLPR